MASLGHNELALLMLKPVGQFNTTTTQPYQYRDSYYRDDTVVNNDHPVLCIPKTLTSPILHKFTYIITVENNKPSLPELNTKSFPVQMFKMFFWNAPPDLHGSLTAKAQAMVSTGSRHFNTTAYRTILLRRGSTGRSVMWWPTSVRSSNVSKASICWETRGKRGCQNNRLLLLYTLLMAQHKTGEIPLLTHLNCHSIVLCH